MYKNKSRPSHGKRRPEDHLPKSKPKRTGRAMPPPEDPLNKTAGEVVADQEQAAIEEGREAAKNKNEADSKEAEQAVAGKKTRGRKQGQLLRVAKQPTPRIQHGRMSAHFVGFRAHRTKNRTKVVTMRFTLELEAEHEGLIPKVIEDEWKHFRKGSVKLTQPEGVGTQNITLATTSDQEPDLEVTCNVPKAVISRVAVRGKGATIKVTRLEIHLLTGFTKEVDNFCRNNYDETAWLVLQEAQTDLGEEEEVAEG